jgi:hypothetical protein
MLATVAVSGHTVCMAGGVEPEAGRAAADIIKAAQQRQAPVLRITKAAALAGITDVGWQRVIKTGRGYPTTFIAMARVVGAEAEVRRALGFPPADTPPSGDERGDDGHDTVRSAIMAADLPAERKQWALERYDAEVRRILADLGVKPQGRRSGSGG